MKWKYITVFRWYRLFSTMVYQMASSKRIHRSLIAQNISRHSFSETWFAHLGASVLIKCSSGLGQVPCKLTLSDVLCRHARVLSNTAVVEWEWMRLEAEKMTSRITWSPPYVTQRLELVSAADVMLMNKAKTISIASGLRVMAWCLMARSHNLYQIWPISMASHGTKRPQ